MTKTDELSGRTLLIKKVSFERAPVTQRFHRHGHEANFTISGIVLDTNEPFEYTLSASVEREKLLNAAKSVLPIKARITRKGLGARLEIL